MGQNDTEVTNKTLVRNFIETVFNERDIEAANDFLVENYHEYSTGNGDSFQSREEFISGNADFLAAFPDLRMIEDGCIAEGDTVVYQHTITGTHEGEIMGVEPTGNKITLENAGVFHIEDGKIADVYLYADNISLMRQLGIIPQDSDTV